MGRFTSDTCRLVTMLTMTATYFLVEITVGEITNSVALVADSFHMLSDIVALAIGLASVRISKWPSRRNTFGWVRAEVLGALVNAVFLLALCFSIFIDSLTRLLVLEEIQKPFLLLGVGLGGLLINVIGLFLFQNHGHSHDNGHGHGPERTKEEWVVGRSKDGKAHIMPDQDPHRPSVTMECEFDDTASDKANASVCGDSTRQLNMRGVFLHLMGDFLGSVVVIVSSLAIWLAEGNWKFYLDPSMSFMMVIIIFTSTMPLLKESSMILLQTTPDFLDQDKLKLELKKVEGVIGVHEFHVWRLSGKRVVLSAHILCNNIREYMKVAVLVKELFHRKGVHSTTIQPEFVELPATEKELAECKLACAHVECQTDTCCGQRDLQASKTARKNRRDHRSMAATSNASQGGADEASSTNLTETKARRSRSSYLAKLFGRKVNEPRGTSWHGMYQTDLKGAGAESWSRSKSAEVQNVSVPLTQACPPTTTGTGIRSSASSPVTPGVQTVEEAEEGQTLTSLSP